MENIILLVDDESDIREVLNLSLSDLGYHVFEAENGQSALGIFEEVRPLVVLTDIKMPPETNPEKLPQRPKGKTFLISCFVSWWLCGENILP